MCSESMQEVIVCMLKYFLQRCPKYCTKTPLKSRLTTYRARITGPELLNNVLYGLYLKTPRKLIQNLFSSWNYCNFKVISKSNILNKYIKKKIKTRENTSQAHTLFIKLFPLKTYKNPTSMDCNSR